MPYALTILELVVEAVVAGVALWVAMKLSREEGSFVLLFVAAFISALVGFVPFAGWLLSYAVLLALICRWTTAELWPDAFFIVIVAWCLQLFAGVVLRKFF